MQQKWSRWPAPERERLAAIYGSAPLPTLLDQFPGRTHNAVMHQVKMLGLYADGAAFNAARLRRYTYDPTYFRVIHPDASYWAGFIAADGCVSVNTLSINLQHGDGLHLAALRTALSHNGPLFPRPATPAHQAQVQFRLHGARPLIEDLERNYNITPRKSLTLQPPASLDRLNSLAFMAGVIDGDGCIRLIRARTPAISVVGTPMLLRWIACWANQLAPGDRTLALPRAVSIGSRLFTYQVTGKRAIRLASQILSLHLPRLERKWAIVAPFCD